MKRIFIPVVGLLFAGWMAWGGTAFAHGERGGSQVVTGEVVDLACYLGEGEMGPAHADCAQKCIASGLPVGIKSGDQLYLVIAGEHGPANATLAPMAGKQVTAEGEVTERDGIHLLALRKVTMKQ